MQKKIEILKITKDKKKFLVETNEKEYKFNEDVIVEFLILKGKVFSEKEFKKIIKANDVSEIFNKTLNYLSFQQRSEYEIYSYIKEKGATGTDIDKIIKKLKDYGYIDDEKLANYLLDLVIRQKKGPKVLEKKLFEKRIDEATTKDVLEKYNLDIEGEVVNSLCEGLVKKNTDKPVRIQKQKIYEKLIRDGFSGEVINHYVSLLEFDDNSLEKLPLEIEKLEYKYRDLDEYKRKEKIIASLLRKGYDYSKITKYL